MTLFKKTETETGQPSYAGAVERYQKAAGDLFIKPAKKLCKYEKNAWILFDAKNELICIIGNKGPVFAANLNCALRQVALSHVK